MLNGRRLVSGIVAGVRLQSRLGSELPAAAAVVVVAQAGEHADRWRTRAQSRQMQSGRAGRTAANVALRRRGAHHETDYINRSL